MKLDAGQKHILKLIARDKKEDGWTPVSSFLYKTLSTDIPNELATFEQLEVGGRAKLTDRGIALLESLIWIE